LVYNQIRLYSILRAFTRILQGHKGESLTFGLGWGVCK